MDCIKYYNELIKKGEEIKNDVPEHISLSIKTDLMENLSEWVTKCLRLMQDILPQGKENIIYNNFEDISSNNVLPNITKEKFGYLLGLLRGLEETVREYVGD